MNYKYPDSPLSEITTSITLNTANREVLRITADGRLVTGEGLSADEATQEAAKLLIASFEGQIQKMVDARIAAELASLRAEVERLKELLRIESASAQHALAAAERAEAELSDERARLDWLLGSSAQTYHSYSNPLGGGNYVQYHKDRAAIDAAMK